MKKNLLRASLVGFILTLFLTGCLSKNKSDTTSMTLGTNKEANGISRIDTNHNGKVSIVEAKAAGFKMPITREHWFYKHMTDRDNDGMVGE